MGVNVAVTAAMATAMTNGSGGWPTAVAKTIATGAKMAVVAESSP